MAITRLSEWVLVGQRWTRMSQMSNYQVHDKVEPELVFVMIPGNPGNDGFYEHFGQKIFEKMEENSIKLKMDFFTVSHLNHVELPQWLEKSSKLHKNDKFSLEEQIQHKFDFFEEHISKKYPTIILAHSIGSFMTLKILPKLLKNNFNIVKTLALFPTIEKMAISPNGLRLGGYLKFFSEHDTISTIVLSWLWMLPSSIKRFLIGFNLKDPSIPDCVVESAMEILNASVVKNIVHMSNDELKRVVDHDPSLFEQPEKLLIYYGQNDGWVPSSCPEEQLKRFGEKHVILDKDNCEHAFVIKDGEIMAKNIVSLVKNLIN